MTASEQRRSNGYGFLAMAVLAVALALCPATAEAQVFKICGDVDDNDTVTVTDGVQILRAAAGLSSDCTDAICDVDVNGTIGVTDGVIILRKAAGLAITENCIPDEGSINNQVAHLVRRTQPLVSEVLGTIVLHRTEIIDNSFGCDNGEDGTYDVTFSDGQQDAAFSTCLVDNAEIDGSADNANDDPQLDLTILDARSEDEISFVGGLLGINVENGVKYSGNLEASPSFAAFEDTSDFLLVVGNVSVSPNGTPLGGSITLEFNADSGVPGIRRVRVQYDGSNLARVVVTFSDGSVKSYKFELAFRNFV
jgi:hypothetical protein